MNDLIDRQPKRTEERTEMHGVCLDAISREDVEQTVEDNILCYTHSDRAIDQDPDTECHMAIRTALRMLRKDLRKLPTAQPEQRWILCSEGIPKKTGYYICTCHDGACYRTSVLKWSAGWVLTGARSYWKVIAWMPLPEPYKEEQDE